MGCMKEKGEEQICPLCGMSDADLGEVAPIFLRPGSELKDRYIVGIALGQGGFGITYIGYDKVLNTRVAIKEYFPSDIAGRTSEAGTVSAYPRSADDFGRGKERFLDEARTLAKFSDHPCIVGVKDCFAENETAYMIMEYLDGVSLKEYLNRKGGRLSVSDSISILAPVMDALCAVHKEGIIHRDISPDNIFITTDGRVRLIDFGAARQTMGGQKSLSVMLKPGYAPEEQYRTRGNQGPWTDVYALTATLYRMITGEVPPDSLERVMEDTLDIPVDLPQNVQTALRIGMAVRSSERYSSVEQLRAALNGQPPTNEEPVRNSVPAQNAAPVRNSNNYENQSVEKRSLGLKITLILISAALVAAIASGAILIFSKGRQEETPPPVPVESSAKSEQEVHPTPVFTTINASNSTTPSNSNRSYSPEMAVDKNAATAWNVPNGIGEWIMLSASSEQYVKGVKILNGYTKFSPTYNMWIYYANSRPCDIELSFSDGTVKSFTLEDIFDEENLYYQTLDFGDYVKTTFIKIRIKSIYNGSKWNDCCISEIEVY